MRGESVSGLVYMNLHMKDEPHLRGESGYYKTGNVSGARDEPHLRGESRKKSLMLQRCSVITHSISIENPTEQNNRIKTIYI